MSSITVEDIDEFIDYMSRKPCKGPKSYGKHPDEIPTLSSGSIKKCYTVLTSGFETAKKWHYIAEVPRTTPPAEKTVKRRAWDAARVYEVMEKCQDCGLLICHPDGRPIDPKNLETAFKTHQRQIGIPTAERIDIQGLRKSGQMHKVRLSKNDYQLVAESAGQSPEVLMSNYNEALDSEKRTLSRLVEGSFYPNLEPEPALESGAIQYAGKSPE